MDPLRKTLYSPSTPRLKPSHRSLSSPLSRQCSPSNKKSKSMLPSNPFLVAALSPSTTKRQVSSPCSSPHKPFHSKINLVSVVDAIQSPYKSNMAPSKSSMATSSTWAGSPSKNAVNASPLSMTRMKQGAGCVSSPIKTKGKSAQFDRFIPNRKAMDLATSQFNISKQGVAANEKQTMTFLDSQDLAYQEEIAKACGLALDKRILAFKAEAPLSDFSKSEQLRTNWNRPMRPPNSKLAKRKIPSIPERVLDAPGMSDDYYLNLLDWSSQNILAVGLDKNVYLWNATTGSVQDFYQTDDNDYIASLQWTQDGSYLAIGTLKGDAQIWDVENNSKIRSMRGHVTRVGVLSWDKHILSSGARDGSIWHHDVRVANHKVAELLGHDSEVCGLKWRPDGLMLASGGNDNLVNIWDARTSVPRHTKTSHTAAVKALAWCPWQLSLLATGGGSQDRHVHFWNSTTGIKQSSIDTGSQVTSIVWSREYKELLTSHGFPNNQLTLWGYPSLKKISETTSAHEARVLHTSLSPDGQTVATVAADENLKFWKMFESRKKTKKTSENQDHSGNNENEDTDGHARSSSNSSSNPNSLIQSMRSMAIR